MEFYDINDNPIDHLTQWETGRKIKIKGLNPSKTYEAHVFNTHSKTAQVMSAVNSQGTITVEIIDRLLQEPYMITVVVHEKTTSTSFAVVRIEIPVEEAARPEKYIPTDPEKPPIAEYVLPIASDITLGGVKGKKKTNENVPVAIDAQGRMFVPPYPTGGGEVNVDLSKVFALDSVNMENVPSSGNLDNYKEPGNYHTPLSATVKNLPEGIDNKEGGAGYLKVMGSQYFGIQILYVFQYLSNPPWSMLRIYFRTGKYNQSSPWSNWKEIYTDNTDITRFVKSNLGVLNKGKILEINEQGDVIPVEKPSGGGGGYTLPVANASTLGGIKAKSKTPGDTVEVSVDGNGKLYVPTYPTGGGGSSNIDYRKVFALNEKDMEKLSSSNNVNELVKSGNFWGNANEVQIGMPPALRSVNSRFYLKVIGSDYYVFQIMYCVTTLSNGYGSRIFSRSAYNDQKSVKFGEWKEFYNDYADNTKLVQDVLKALPTWNGGTY